MVQSLHVGGNKGCSWPQAPCGFLFLKNSPVSRFWGCRSSWSPLSLQRSGPNNLPFLHKGPIFLPDPSPLPSNWGSSPCNRRTQRRKSKNSFCFLSHEGLFLAKRVRLNTSSAKQKHFRGQSFKYNFKMSLEVQRNRQGWERRLCGQSCHSPAFTP